MWGVGQWEPVPVFARGVGAKAGSWAARLGHHCPNLVDLLLGQGKMETVGFTGFEIAAEQVSSVLQGFFLSFPESADVV